MAIAARVGDMPALGLDELTARKCFRRFIWFLFILYSIAYLDRINIGFAALSMNKELGLSAFAFGLASTIFYAGYVLCEIPSNLVLAKVGARIWIARIMITWGIFSMATMLVTGTNSLYVIRLMVGIAEAGFTPGVLLYMTYWFPRSYRARANTIFLMAGAVAVAYSAISGIILELDGTLGLSGWRWLFLLEGAPAVILGVITFFYLTDRPAAATWLSAEEKGALQSRLDRERMLEEASTGKRGSIARQLANSDMVLLSLAYFGLVLSFSANATWTPQIIREWASGASFSSVGLITALPAVVTVAVMPLWGAHSDRVKERNWHLCLPLLLAAAGWVLVGMFSDPSIRLLGLVCSSTGIFTAQPIFWTLPASAAVLPLQVRPAGIALINVFGITGSIVSPMVIGYLKDLTGSFTSGLLFVAVMLVVAAICSSIVARRHKSVI